MIRRFCYKLPREVSIQMYSEYERKMKEIQFQLNYPHNLFIKEDLLVIEMILALSLFNKHVINNLDAANKFAGSVFKKSTAESIRIGKYELTPKEQRHLYAIVRNFQDLITEFSIPNYIFQTFETKDFLKEIRSYKKNAEIRDKNNK